MRQPATSAIHPAAARVLSNRDILRGDGFHARSVSLAGHVSQIQVLRRMINHQRNKIGQLGASAFSIALCSAISLAGNTSLRRRRDLTGRAMRCSPMRWRRARAIVMPRFPEPSRHTHFPPGYPAALAVLWSMTGRSLAAAHFSPAPARCRHPDGVVVVPLFYPPRVAFILGLALAVNWTWGRYGGAVLSEPMFLLLGQLALLVAVRAGRRGGLVLGVVLGALLAACVLTRHVGVSLVGALGIDLLLRRRRTTAAAAGLTCGALLLPWVAWLALAGTPNQAGLLPSAMRASAIGSQPLPYFTFNGCRTS